MLDTHRLRVFRSVMASGSIQAAATNLGYTSSAISQQITALQRETGLTLFTREGRGLSPTPAARALVANSDELMSQLSRLDSAVADLREGRSGRLTIGYFASAGAEWMPTLAKRLTTEMPDLTLELVLTEIQGRKGFTPDLDIIIDSPDALVPPGSHRTALADDPYVALLNRDHPLARESSISLAQLQADTWISSDLPQNPCSRILTAACESAGFRPRYAVQAQDHYTAIAFVNAGVGVTVVPRLASHVLPKGVRCVELTAPQPIRHISALVRETAPPNPAAHRAVELLIELIG